MLRTKAQVSTTDYLVGLVIIIIALLLAVQIIAHMQPSSTFDQVRAQASSASEQLMSEGIPRDWNASSVLRLGVLSGHVLNISKWEFLGSVPYPALRSLLTDTAQVYVYLSNETHVLNISGCGRGSPAISVDDECKPFFDSDSNIVSIERFVAFNDSIIRMDVVVWE